APGRREARAAPGPGGAVPADPPPELHRRVRRADRERGPPARVGDRGPGGDRALRGVPAPDPPRGAAAGRGAAGVPALHGPDGGATAAVRTRSRRAATTHPAGPRRG